MNAPEPPGQQPDDPSKRAGDAPDPASTDALLRALDAYQKGTLANNAEQVEAAALDALRIAAEQAEKNPSPELLFKMEAGDCEARGDWAGAEACYRKVLSIQEAAGNFALIFKAHHELGRLFLLVGDLEKAETCARAATAAARQTDLFALHVIALQNQANCALRRLDYAGALEAASEAVALVEPGRLQDRRRASALVTRARCRLASGDFEGADSDLAACKPILLEQDVSPMFAGVHSDAAAWWEVAAGIRAHHRDLAGAVEAWTQAVNGRRHVASLGHVSGPHTSAALARALRHLGEALHAAGQPEEGQTALAEAQQVWREIGLPEQPKP